MAGWRDGWMTVTRRYCVCLNGEINLKTFSTTGSPVIPICSQPCADTQFQGESFQPGLVAFYDIRPGNGAGLFLQPRSAHTAPIVRTPICAICTGVEFLPAQDSGICKNFARSLINDDW